VATEEAAVARKRRMWPRLTRWGGDTDHEEEEEGPRRPRRP
jgi:hypothetical protein